MKIKFEVEGAELARKILEMIEKYESTPIDYTPTLTGSLAGEKIETTLKPLAKAKPKTKKAEPKKKVEPKPKPDPEQEESCFVDEPPVVEKEEPKITAEQVKNVYLKSCKWHAGIDIEGLDPIDEDKVMTKPESSAAHKKALAELAGVNSYLDVDPKDYEKVIAYFEYMDLTRPTDDA